MKKIIISIISILFIILFSILIWFHFQTRDPIYNDALKQLKNPGVLTVAGNVPYGIMEFFNDKGEPDGFEVDLSKTIAKKLGVKLQYLNYDWDYLFSGVLNKEADVVISSVTITPDRSSKFLFSNPYFYGGQVVIVRSDDSRFIDFSDIKGKKIGAQEGTTNQAEASKYTDVKKLFIYKDFSDVDSGFGIVHDLADKKIDLIVTDFIQAITVVKKNKNFKILGEPFTQEYYGVMTNKNNDRLIQAVNEIIREMKHSGELSALENKWKK